MRLLLAGAVGEGGDKIHVTNFGLGAVARTDQFSLAVLDAVGAATKFTSRILEGLAGAGAWLSGGGGLVW
jgi:hypothetical protein